MDFAAKWVSSLACRHGLLMTMACTKALQLEPLDDGLGQLQDDVAASPHTLCCDIRQLTANRVGVTGNRQNVLEVVFLEGLKQEEGDHHYVVVGLVGSIPLERQLLRPELLQSAMRQFVGAALMVVKDQFFIAEPLRTGSEIRQDDVVGSGKVQQSLPIFVFRTRVESPVRVLPFVALILEAGVAPLLPSIVIDFPFLLPNGGHFLLDRLERLAGTNEMNAQLIAELKVLLIEKAGVHPDHDVH